MSETSEMRRIYIFDTTLRDGEQSPGCTMNLRDKLLVAEHLEALWMSSRPVSRSPSHDWASEHCRRGREATVASAGRCPG